MDRDEGCGEKTRKRVTGPVRSEEDLSEGTLAPAVFLISHHFRQLLARWERVRVEERESEHSQIRTVFMFITADQKVPRVVRHREGLKQASKESFGRTGFVTDPLQQGRYRVGANSSNGLRSLIKLLRRWTSAVISWAPYSSVRAVGAHVQPLLERPAVVNRLVIVGWWQDKDDCDNKREPNKGPEQGLSALPHVRKLA